jgi:peptide/nickel transport system permease protein
LASLKAYVITRVLLTIPTVLILLTLVFILIRAIPGNPFLTELGEHNSKVQAAILSAKYGLNQPIYVQYVKYIILIFHGDLGNSFSGSQLPVSYWIALKFPATVELTIAAMMVALLVGVFGGVQSAYRRNTAVDYGVRVYGNVIYSVPIFWLGLMFQVVFAVYLHWLPSEQRISTISAAPNPVVFAVGPININTSGYYILNSILTLNLPAFEDSVAHIILPALTLGLVLSGVFTRITRANMLDTLKRDFITAGRARGLSERSVVYRHALRNASIPIFTILGLQVALLLAGAILTETVFSWDGVGKLLLDSINVRDYPVVEGVIIVYAILVAVISTVVDIFYAVLDPRIRL